MITHTLQEFQAKEIAHIGELIRAGLDTSELLGAKSAGKLFAYRNRLRSELLDKMKEAGEFGKRQVNAELKRQG